MCSLLSFEVERIGRMGANLGQLRGECGSHDGSCSPLQRTLKRLGVSGLLSSTRNSLQFLSINSSSVRKDFF